jgi:hypothetical protein
MTIQTPPGGGNEPDLPDPVPDPEPDPEPGGPIPAGGSPLQAPGADGPPMRLPREDPAAQG